MVYTCLIPTGETHFTSERRQFVVCLFLRCCQHSQPVLKIFEIIVFNRSEFSVTMTTTQQPGHLTIPVLTASNYHEWRLSCTTAAKQCLPTNGPLGGLGILLPPTEYAELNNNEPYTLAVKPPSVTNAQHTHLQSVYDREQVAIGALTAAVFGSIPMATQQSCPGYHAMYGTSFVPLPTMMSHIHAKFGDASVNAYTQAKISMQQPYTPGMDIDIFLATQVAAHNACIRAGNPLNNIEKVNALISAVGGRSGPFAFTISNFEEHTSNIAHRTFEDTLAVTAIPDVAAVPAIAPSGEPDSPEYNPGRPGIAYVPGRAAEEPREGLASRLRKAAPRIVDVPPTPTTTQGYYGAAEVVATIRDTVKQVLAEAVTTANATQRRDRNPPRRDLYCWSHGLGGHSSTQCKNPRTGHDSRATATKRMGGSIKGCPK